MAKVFSQYWRVIFLIAGLALVLWLMWTLRNILLPFFIGLILAYLLLPIVRWVEIKLPLRGRWLHAKRTALVIFVYLIVIGILILLGILTIPSIVDSVADFIANLPQWVPELVDRFQEVLSRIQQSLPSSLRDQINTNLSNVLGTVGGAISGGFVAAVTYLTSTIGLILGFAALPVFLFYLLNDAENLKNSFYSGMTPWTREKMENIIQIIQDMLGRYIRSQLILGLIVGGLVFIGLLILGIPYAPALAFVAAVTELIPILGPWIGGAAGVVVTLVFEPSKTIWVAILYLAIQLLEGNLLVPRIQGRYLQIHPAVILILLVVGGYFAGLWGIILIVPVTATLAKLYQYMSLVIRKEQIERPQL